MLVTHDMIRSWITEGQAAGATHMVVVCDTFSNEYHPIYVSPSQNARDIADRERKKTMQKIMEVYWLLGDIEGQLALESSFNYGPA